MSNFNNVISAVERALELLISLKNKGTASFV